MSPVPCTLTVSQLSITKAGGLSDTPGTERSTGGGKQRYRDTYQVAFDKLKSLVCEDTTLRYFNTKKPVTIQVNASSKGLGAALIQDDGPVTFVSKALTLCKQ